MRVGHGFDVHAFTAGDHVILGGVRIAFDRALKAHSDGDVVLHALSDALLGAAGLGDIGEHFPDTDPNYRGADSRQLLACCMQKVFERKWMVSNVDLTVLAEVPKLKNYKLQMQKQIAEDLQIAIDCVNIKATTTERLGFIGREEGIAAHAVVLLTHQGQA